MTCMRYSWFRCLYFLLLLHMCKSPFSISLVFKFKMKTSAAKIHLLIAREIPIDLIHCPAFACEIDLNLKVCSARAGRTQRKL